MVFGQILCVTLNILGCHLYNAYCVSEALLGILHILALILRLGARRCRHSSGKETMTQVK